MDMLLIFFNWCFMQDLDNPHGAGILAGNDD